MNNKIEPGMLCLVYGLKRDTHANGTVTTAVRWLTNGDWVPEVGALYDLGGEWLCVDRDGQFNGYLPANLMPLHPPAEEPSQCARQSKLIPA